MSYRTVIDCDRCGQRNVKESRRVVVNPGSLSQEGFDFCPDCLALLLYKELHAESWTQDKRKEWIKQIKKDQKNITSP